MIKDLGQVAAIYIGTTEPINYTLLWLDTNTNPGVYKAYDSNLKQWVPLATQSWVQDLIDNWIQNWPVADDIVEGDYILINKGGENYKIEAQDIIQNLIGKPLNFQNIVSNGSQLPASASDLKNGDLYILNVPGDIDTQVVTQPTQQVFLNRSILFWDEGEWKSMGRVEWKCDLSMVQTSDTVTINSSLGTGITIPTATDSQAGVLSAILFTYLTKLSNGTVIPRTPNGSAQTPGHIHNYTDIEGRIVVIDTVGDINKDLDTSNPPSQRAVTEALYTKYDKTGGEISGIVRITDGTEATQLGEGALIVNGGLSIFKNVYFGENLDIVGATYLHSTLDVDGITHILNTTNSTANNNGALVVDGGVGIAKNVNIGGAVDVDGNSSLHGTLTVDGATTLNNTLHTVGAVTFDNTLDVDGATTLNSTLDVDGATTLNNTLDVDGASVFHNTVKVEGITSITNTTASTDYNNGALVVTGGVGIQGALNTHGAVDFDSTLNVDGVTTISNTTDSTSTSTGALVVKGGTGIAKQLRVGGATNLGNTLNVVGATTLNNTLHGVGAVTFDSTLTVTGATQLNNTLGVTGIVTVTNTTDATSTTTGSIHTAGGVGIAKQLRVGGNTNLGGTLTVAGDTVLNSDLTVNGNTEVQDITIHGNVTQEGQSFITEAETVEIKDNILLINKGEVGAGVTAGLAGIEVDRGTSPNFQFVFDESDDYFKAGEIGDLQILLLRDADANLTNNKFFYWDNANKIAKTREILIADISDLGATWDAQLKGAIYQKVFSLNNSNIGLYGYVSAEKIGPIYAPTTMSTNSNQVLVGSSTNMPVWDYVKLIKSYTGDRVSSLAIGRNTELGTSMYTRFDIFSVAATNLPGTDSISGDQINDGVVQTYFWDNTTHAVQLALDVDGTGVAYRSYNPADGTVRGSWKFLASTSWVNTSVNTKLQNYLPLSGGTMTGIIRIPYNGLQTSGNASNSLIFYNDSELWYGSTPYKAVFDTSNTDMIHRKYGVNYIIYDESNFVAGTDYLAPGAVTIADISDLGSTWDSYLKAGVYNRNITVNGTSYPVMTNVSGATAINIYAPTTAGTSGQILQSTGGAPTWTNDNFFRQSRAILNSDDLDTFVSRASGTYTVNLSGSTAILAVLARQMGSTSALEFYSNYLMTDFRVRTTIDNNRYNPWKYFVLSNSGTENIANYVKLNGDSFKPNNMCWGGTRTDGTTTCLAFINPENIALFGHTSLPLRLRSSSNPTVLVGTSTYTLLHTGNIGSITFTGAVSATYNGTNDITVNIPQGGGGTADSVAWENVTNKPTWIGATKPSYSYSEITGTVPISDIPTGTTSSTVALGNHTHNTLYAVDDRDIQPSATGLHGSKAIRPYFRNCDDVISGYGTYADFLYFDTYGDNSGGKVNGLAMCKNSMRILHYQGTWNSSWTTVKPLAYLDDIPDTVSISISGGGVTSNQYVSGLSYSNGVISVSKGTLPTVSLSALGITATAAELNKLDGLTATTTELNYVDGVTSNIQTQLNNKAASTHTHPVAQINNLGTNWSARLTATINVKSVNINGTATSYLNTTNATAVTIYAPTSAGTDGYLLVSNGSGAPSWASVSSVVGTGFVTIDTAQTITGTKTFTAYTIFSNGAGTATSSDKRLKENIKEITYNKGFDEISLYSYNFKGRKEEKIGLIAQEVQKVIPQAVIEDEEGYLAIDTYPIVATLVAANGERVKEVKDLKSEIDNLKQEIEMLKQEISILKRIVRL